MITNTRKVAQRLRENDFLLGQEAHDHQTRHIAESCTTVHQTFQPWLKFTVLIRISMNLHNLSSNMKMRFTCLFTCIFIKKQRFM